MAYPENYVFKWGINPFATSVCGCTWRDGTTLMDPTRGRRNQDDKSSVCVMVPRFSKGNSCFVRGNSVDLSPEDGSRDLGIAGGFTWTTLGQSRACPDECAQTSDCNTIPSKLLMGGGNSRRKGQR